MSWLRRSFIAGFFVMVPLFISVAALIWLFNLVDGASTPLYDRLARDGEFLDWGLLRRPERSCSSVRLPGT